MDRQFWGVAAVRQGVKALSERRKLLLGSREMLEPACNAAARESLEAAGYKVFAPSVVEDRWHTKRGGLRVVVKTLVPLFPGYLFFGWDDVDGWREAPHARGVLDVLRDGDRFAPPAPISRRTMLLLLAAGELLTGVAPAPAAACDLEIGDRVKITNGPFAGMLARILSFKGKKRMKAFLELEALTARGAKQVFDLEVDTRELARRSA